MRTTLAARCAPRGKMVHLVGDALPSGWACSPFGPDGARCVAPDGAGSIIVTRADHIDGFEVCHASIAWPDRDPSYRDLVMLHRAVFGDGWAYQVFAPASEHINIHEHALHLWGRADGEPMLPDFTMGAGSI